MERWTGRVAVVTGTSSGIGAAIAKELVKKGVKVVGIARRVERVEALSKSLKSEKGELHPLKCDITKDDEIKKAFAWVKSNLGGVDILVNNAAVAIDAQLIGSIPFFLHQCVQFTVTMRQSIVFFSYTVVSL
ncbi:Farnesol dehydrogenase [Blattella germanica]|nr:Farnesol dehydrogenase [Blattella germanica]